MGLNALSSSKLCENNLAFFREHQRRQQPRSQKRPCTLNTSTRKMQRLASELWSESNPRNHGVSPLRFQLFSSLVAPHGLMDKLGFCPGLPLLPCACRFLTSLSVFELPQILHLIGTSLELLPKIAQHSSNTRGSMRKASSPRMTSSEVLLCFHYGQEGNYTISDHHVISCDLSCAMSLYVTILNAKMVWPKGWVGTRLGNLQHTVSSMPQQRSMSLPPWQQGKKDMIRIS